jgi:hypothetical protein
MHTSRPSRVMSDRPGAPRSRSDDRKPLKADMISLHRRYRAGCGAGNSTAINWSASPIAKIPASGGDGSRSQIFSIHLVTPSSDTGIRLDEILNSMGMRRRIVASVPHYLAIPSLIGGTDLLAHSRRELLNVFRAASELVSLPVPVPFVVPDLVFSHVWHARQDLDRGQIWLRDAVNRALNRMGAE